MFELVYHDGTVERVVPLSHDVVLGRSPECDVVLRAPDVSHRHAGLALREGAWRLLDLASSQGTCVNGVSVRDAALADGDQIALGDFPILFRQRLDEKIVLDTNAPLLQEQAVGGSSRHPVQLDQSGGEGGTGIGERGQVHLLADGGNRRCRRPHGMDVAQAPVRFFQVGLE